VIRRPAHSLSKSAVRNSFSAAIVRKVTHLSWCVIKNVNVNNRVKILISIIIIIFSYKFSMLPSTLYSPVQPPSILKSLPLCSSTDHRLSCQSADRQPLLFQKRRLRILLKVRINLTNAYSRSTCLNCVQFYCLL